MKIRKNDIATGMLCGLFVLGMMFICTKIAVGLINQYVALSSDYKYAQFATFSMDKTLIYFLLPFIFVYTYIILQTLFHWINNVELKKKVYFTAASILPLIMIAVQYQSTDEFMYKPISTLYDETVKENPNFIKSPIGIKFAKALSTHDYVTLKEVSNDLEALKMIDLKTNQIIEVVNLFPLKSVDTFNKMITDSQGFVSLSDYKKFYDGFMTEFKSSPIADKKEFVFLIVMIHPDKLKY